MTTQTFGVINLIAKRGTFTFIISFNFVLFSYLIINVINERIDGGDHSRRH